MTFLQVLVALALLQVVKLQEEGKMNVSALSTGCTAVVLLFTKCHYLVNAHTGDGYGQCVNREEFELVRAETKTVKRELHSWQNTTISILKTYLLDQGTLSTHARIHARIHAHTLLQEAVNWGKCE